jgi:hypothetical protein
LPPMMPRPWQKRPAIDTRMHCGRRIMGFSWGKV